MSLLASGRPVVAIMFPLCGDPNAMQSFLSAAIPAM